VRAAQARGVRRGQVVGSWRSPVCSPAAWSSLTTRSWAAQHKGPGGGGTGTVTQRVGGTFPPCIRLPPQGTSLGLCELALGTSSSSRAARLEDLDVSLGGNKAE
jgi:hypothetical protein